MSLAEIDTVPDSGRLVRMFALVRNILFGMLACFSPITSIIALGWLETEMRRVALRRAGLAVEPGDRPHWITNPQGASFISRNIGGLFGNIRRGLALALCLLVVTLPATGLWAGSWWGGWENSFNKGYEQAFVGPLFGILGVLIFMISMTFIPFALAHQAVEGRPYSFFEFRRVRSALRNAGWRYVFWALTSLVATLPLVGARVLPIFIEFIYPPFIDMNPEQISALRTGIDLAIAAYVFMALYVLRRWLAAFYAKAAMRAASGPDHALWAGSRLSGASFAGTRRPWRSIGAMRFMLVALVWGAVAFLIYFGQFMNLDWALWINHPFVLLPWWH